MSSLNARHGSIVCRRILMMILIISSAGIQCESSQAKKQKISISGAFALYPLTVRWAEEFNRLHPDIRFDISAGGAGKGMTDALSGAVDLGMFSRALSPAEIERGVWYIAVTKDAVLPTISVKNPVLSQLKAHGLTRETFRDIFMNGRVEDWGKVTGQPPGPAINVYTRSDACGAAGTWAEYLGGVQENLRGIGIFGDPGLADAVKKDPFGIGYNNTIYIYNQRTKLKYDGLEVIPLDINENGMVDPEENFYDDLDQVIDAIENGQYPSPPARELYFVAGGKPNSEPVITFLQWVLQEGQKYVLEAGYVPLKSQRIKTELLKLSGKP